MRSGKRLKRPPLSENLKTGLRKGYMLSRKVLCPGHKASLYGSHIDFGIKIVGTPNRNRTDN